MRVTVRPARESDRETYNWRYFGASQSRPMVVSVTGHDPWQPRRAEVVLVLEGDTIVYQNGSPGIADLVRGVRRVFSALATGLEHPDAERHSEERLRAAFAKLRGES